MGNCGTCKWWEAPKNEGLGRCILISDTHEDSPAFDDDSEYTDKAWADCRGKRCIADTDFYTDEDFGCTLHEPKEESDGA